jgi:hypothetical protein
MVLVYVTHNKLSVVDLGVSGWLDDAFTWANKWYRTWQSVQAMAYNKLNVRVRVSGE